MRLPTAALATALRHLAQTGIHDADGTIVPTLTAAAQRLEELQKYADASRHGVYASRAPELD